MAPALAARAAMARCCLLITGETGVGKGWLARWMHEHSPRADRPFIPVNCGAIPESLIDSQLFGHVRGAFSDAHQDHTGLVRAADGGTLLLDEIGELPHSGQLRLLRLLEEGEVQPVGAMRPVCVDVRVIAATRYDLSRAVAEGRLREDLYFRLNVIHFHLAPLRERREEIARLAEAFNEEFAARIDRPPLLLAEEAMRFLRAQPWPGNVRQLRTVIERLHVLCPSDVITVEELRRYGQLEDPPSRRADSRGLWPRRARLEAAREAMEACDGSISRAAHALGVHRSTVHRWLAGERLAS
ncbi:MAG: sigma-54 dependent transcriptional regulator [Planctomycetota bacterium]|nr:sigma-54 dependent transcriptional regulator [Planctomycetota bacterium]